MDMRFAVDQLASQAQRFAAFTGITEPKLSDRFFLVMGMTGSGKSTFVGQCTGKDVTVGHGLYSCTDSIDVFDFQWNGRRVYLIDTPGFNDTNRSDIDTLSILATYLGASHANGVRIHGIVMLHPISDNRMSGSSMRNLEMMKAMCGFTTYDNLVIATTMWPETPSYTEAASLGTRESELLSDERFFGALVTRGATVFRHNEKGHQDSPEWMASAQRIVAHLILQAERHPPGALQLQREMIEQKKALGETEAGIAVARDLYKAQQAHKRQLQQLEARYEAEKSQKNVEHAADLHELRVELEKKLEGVEKDQQTLRSSMQEMYQKEKEALKERTKALEKKLRADLAAKEQELRDMEDSLKAIRQDMARRSKTPRQDKQVIQIARHEEEVRNVREEVSEAQTSYKEFVGQTEHFLGKGIGSGVAAGVIAGGQGFQSSALVYSDGAQAFAGSFLCTVM